LAGPPLPYKGQVYRSLPDTVRFPGPRKARGDTTVQEVKIGLFGPSLKPKPGISTPQTARMGLSLFRGAKLALDEANEEGGYKGRPFVLVHRQVDGPWGIASREMVRLVYEDEVWAVLGSVDGPNSHIAEQICTKAWVPVVTPTATDPSLTQVNDPWLFRCIPTDEDQAAALAEYIFRIKGYTKVGGVFLDDDDENYGRIGMREFERTARRMGHPLTMKVGFRLGQKDFSDQVELVTKDGPEALVIWGTPEESGRFVRELREAGLKQDVFGSSALAVPTFLEAAGRWAEGVTVVYPYDPSRPDSLTQQFNRRFTERYGEPPDFYAAYAYDGMRMIIYAIRKAGLNQGRIRDVLAGIRGFPGVTGPITLDGSGNRVTPLKLAVVRGGRFVDTGWSWTKYQGGYRRP